MRSVFLISINPSKKAAFRLVFPYHCPTALQRTLFGSAMSRATILKEHLQTMVCGGCVKTIVHDQQDEPMNILVFGGDFAIRELLRELLRFHGRCQVEIDAEHALDAWQQALEQRKRYHLLVCDMIPPGRRCCSGDMQTLWAMRALERSAGLCSCNYAGMLLVGAFLDPGGLGSVMEDLAPAAFLRKPFEERDLLLALQRLGLVLDA